MSKFPILKSKEVISALLKAGFKIIRTRGSHFRFEHVLTKRKVSVSFHPKIDIPIKTMKSILKQSGLSVKEFLKCFKK